MKNVIRLFLAVAYVFMPLSQAMAYDEDTARANSASDLAECAAYATIGGEGARRLGDAEGESKGQAIASKFFAASSRYSREDVAQAKMQLALRHQAELIDHDYANFALLIVKYGEFCKNLLENPEQRLEYWRRMR